MESKLITVSPQVAQALLKGENRPVKHNRVDYYARLMKEGKWYVETGEAIKISKTGKLLDGQHRLLAVIKSGVTVQFFVITGLNDEVFLYIDQGLPRTAFDAFFISGTKNANTLPSIIRFYLNLEAGKGSSNSALQISNNEVMSIYNSNSSFWDNVAKYSSRWYNEFSHIISPSFIGGFYAHFFNKDSELAYEFMESLCTGTGALSANVTTLRQRLIGDKLKTAKLPIVMKRAMVIKTWNACRTQGTKTKLLRFTKSQEEFPVAI